VLIGRERYLHWRMFSSAYWKREVSSLEKLYNAGPVFPEGLGFILRLVYVIPFFPVPFRQLGVFHSQLGSLSLKQLFWALFLHRVMFLWPFERARVFIDSLTGPKGDLFMAGW
jgi:hypothetical protein